MSIATTSAEVLLFAITSAIKVGGQIRQSYVNNLQSKQLTLPLPNVDMSVDNFQITDFFSSHSHLLDNPQIAKLHKAQQERNLTDEESKRYKNFFEISYSQENQDSNSPVQGDDLGNLLRFRQWANDEDAPVSGLKLVAGSLIDVGVDFFLQVPGALNVDTPYGQSLKTVLTSLDEVDFASGNVKQALFQQVAPKLFTTAIEAIDELAPEISSDVKVQGFIKTATTGFVQDISGRLEGLQTEEETATIQQWGQWMFRSAIQNSGEALFSSSSALFADENAQSALIRSTGLAVMDILLTDDASGVDFKKVFTTESLNTLMASAFSTIGEYPELVSENNFVQSVVSGVAQSVASTDMKKVDLIPELSRLIIAQSAENLTQLFDFESDNPKHLLVTASQQVLQAISAQPADGKWKLQFTNKQVLGLTTVLFDEVVQNPAWVTDKVGENSLLSDVLQVTFASLQAIPADKRLSTATFQSLIQINVKAVAINQLLLKKLPVSADGREQAALGYLLDGAFGYLYGEKTAVKASLSMAKAEIMEGTLEKLLTAVANQPISVSLIDQTLKLEFEDPESQLMAGFLNAIDGVNFENGFKKALFQQIAPEFMTSAISIAQEIVPELVDDENFKALLTSTSNQLAQALTAKINENTEDGEAESLKIWSKGLMKSLAYNAGVMVFSPESNFFGVNEAENALISSTGIALLNSVAEAKSLKAVLKGDALDEILTAALSVTSEYPQLFVSSEPMQNLISGVAGSLTESGIDQPNLFPELLRLTLEKTGENLEQLWDVADTSSQNLLVLASKNILSAISAKPKEGKWKPTFSLQQSLNITSSLLDQVVENPAWVTDLVGDKTILSVALQETFKAMEAIPKEKRLHTSSVQLLLTHSVKAVAMRKQLLDKLPGTGEQQDTILNYAMSSVFAMMYGNTEQATAQWAITKLQTANLIFESFLNKITIQPASKESVDKSLETLKLEINKATQNLEFDSVVFLKGFLGG